MADSDDTPAPVAAPDMEQYNAAYDHFGRGDYRLALDVLGPLVARYPAHPSLNQLFAACLLHTGQNDAAREHLAGLLRDNPRDASLMLMAAQTYNETGERGLYRKTLRDIVALGGDDRSSLLADAYLKRDSGRHQEAYDAFARVFGDPMRINYAVPGAEAGGVAGGAGNLREAEQRDLNFIPLLARMGRVADAQILMEKSLMLYPDSKYMLLTAAQVAGWRKDFRAGYGYFLRAKAVAPEDLHVVGGLFVTSLLRFRVGEAFRHLRDLLRICFKRRG